MINYSWSRYEASHVWNGTLKQPVQSVSVRCITHISFQCVRNVSIRETSWSILRDLYAAMCRQFALKSFSVQTFSKMILFESKTSIYIEADRFQSRDLFEKNWTKKEFQMKVIFLKIFPIKILSIQIWMLNGLKTCAHFKRCRSEYCPSTICVHSAHFAHSASNFLRPEKSISKDARKVYKMNLVNNLIKWSSKITIHV